MTHFKIGSVVQTLGIPASTLRYYETVGLIRPVARVGNSRHYTQSDITHLKFIQLAQSIGFSIDEIKMLFEVFSGEEGDTERCHEIAQLKLNELEAKISDLNIMRDSLMNMSNCACSSIESCVESAESIKTNSFNKVKSKVMNNYRL